MKRLLAVSTGFAGLLLAAGVSATYYAVSPTVGFPAGAARGTWFVDPNTFRVCTRGPGNHWVVPLTFVANPSEDGGTAQDPAAAEETESVPRLTWTVAVSDVSGPLSCRTCVRHPTGDQEDAGNGAASDVDCGDPATVPDAGPRVIRMNVSSTSQIAYVHCWYNGKGGAGERACFGSVHWRF